MGGLSFLLSLVAVLNPPEGTRLESRVQTRSGLFERFVDLNDERYFLVQLTRDGNTQVIKDFRKPASQDSETARVFFGLTGGPIESQTVMVREGSKWSILGESPRVFHLAPCGALGVFDFPTPFSQKEIFTYSSLECSDPLTTKTTKLNVVGRQHKNWLNCPQSDLDQVCLWNPRFETESEAVVQLAAFGHLYRAQGELLLSGIDAFLPELKAESWAFDANYSSYDANEKLLLYGGGQYPDARDGFIVAHEWTHFLIDEINPGLIGYEAKALHEGLADFFAANLHNSPCIAPYDAQEESLECLRDLRRVLKYPEDMMGGAAHEISVIFSSALWRAREFIPPSLLNELIVETVIQLKKYATFQKTWQVLVENYARMIATRPLLKDNLNEITRIGQEQGLGL